MTFSYTIILIIITCIISFITFNNEEIKSNLLFSPYQYVNYKKWWILISHGFIHADFLHLFFNMIWSIIFFGFHQIGLALLDLVLILIFIVILMKIYYLKDKISFSLMVPYFLWSSYALVLNFNIFILN